MGICGSKSSARRNDSRCIERLTTTNSHPERRFSLPHLLPTPAGSPGADRSCLERGDARVTPSSSLELLHRKEETKAFEYEFQQLDDFANPGNFEMSLLRHSRRASPCTTFSFGHHNQLLEVQSDFENESAHNVVAAAGSADPCRGRNLGYACWSYLQNIYKDLHFLRLLRIASTGALCADMYLDGGVETYLGHNGFCWIGAIMAASIIVPQVLTWFFLRAILMSDMWALFRIVFFPCISVCSSLLLWLSGVHTWLSYVASFLIVVSIEPWYLLVRSLDKGTETVQFFWARIAEGMIEAPISNTLTLYISLILSSVRVRGPSMLFATSLLMGLVSMSLASTSLNYYRESPPWLLYIGTLVLVKLPQVSSQVLGYAFFAFACSPLAKDVQDLQEHNGTFLVWAFVALELSLNIGIIRSMAAKLSLGKVVVIACTMAVGGPPRFLRSLDAARPAHAIQHFMILLVMSGVSLRISSHEHFLQITEHHYTFLALLVTTSLVAFLGTLATSLTMMSPSDRLRQAGSRLDQALLEEDVIMAGLLIEVDDAVVDFDKTHLIGECSSALPDECFINIGKCERGKWSGIAESHGKLYCCPRHAAEVLVIDAETHAISFIDTGREQGGWKWSGIAECHGKLYCCPFNAADVLVIDPITEVISFIDTGKGHGDCKWNGIAECHGKLYCCPRDAAEVLVIDPGSETISFIDTGKGKGDSRWTGIAECNGRLYCCPKVSSEVLVIDPAAEVVSFIDTGRQGGSGKWDGIAECGGKLYCCPKDSAEVLVIDSSSGVISFIDTGRGQGGAKWREIVECRGKLYCCPDNEAEVMVIDPTTEVVSFIDTGRGQGAENWFGAVVSHGKLYYCPGDADEIMLIDPCAVRETRASLLEKLYDKAPWLRAPQRQTFSETAFECLPDETDDYNINSYIPSLARCNCCWSNCTCSSFDTIVESLRFRRSLCCASTCLLCVDMYLDGNVEIHLMQDGFYPLAVIMAASIVVPQFFSWLFLQSHKMTDVRALLRTIIFPCIAACSFLGFWLSNVECLRDAAAFLIVVSIEPWYLLYRSWHNWSEVVQSVWARFAEAIIEAPSCLTVTLYAHFLLRSVHVQTPSTFFASTVTSFASISFASASLNYYGERPRPSWQTYIITLVFVKLPKVSSQILGYAFFAFACRPLAKDVQDLQEHNGTFLVWAFVALELSLNIGIIRSMAAKLSLGKVVIIACTMAVGGPPSFLRSLDAARPAHAIQHFMILLVMSGVSLRISSHEHFLQIIEHHYAFLALLVTTSLVAFLGTLATSLTMISPSDRLRQAGCRLDQAIVQDDVIMAGLLIEMEGAEVNVDKTHLIGECSQALPNECFIDTGRGQGGWKWAGIAESHGKLYCCPRDAADILVIDPATNAISFIDTGREQGDAKWCGLAECHGKLYCCPHNAAEVMVIDPAPGIISFIDTGKGRGGCKWRGISEYQGKLYCCPFHAEEVLVIDPAAAAVSFISTGKGQGGWKWRGIAQCNGKLYCCPFNAAEVMVIDPSTEAISFIDTGREQVAKWSEILESNGKLYCCPNHAADVLVLDPATQAIHFIDTCKGEVGSKWFGITKCHGLVYCCPLDAAEVLVIDPATEAVSFIDPGKGGGSLKWLGIAECNGNLYCCPLNAADVMKIPLQIVQDTREALLEHLFHKRPSLRPGYHSILPQLVH